MTATNQADSPPPDGQSDQIVRKMLRELILDVRRALRENGTAEELGFRTDAAWPGLTEMKSELIPEVYALSPCYPNPFNPLTAIAYGLPQAGDVTLTVHTITGQHIATLVSGYQQAGYHEVMWDGAGFGSGLYLYRLQAGSFIRTGKMAKIE